MDIFEEELEQEKKKRMKTVKNAIIISIVVLVVVAIVIMGVTMSMQSKKLSVVKDQVQIVADTTIFDIQEESGKVYIDIEKFAKLIGCNFQKGDEKDQDEKKGCILREEENTFFEANSRKVRKKLKEKEDADEYYYIDEPIMYNNGKLYATIEDSNLIFNVNMGYDETQNRIIINSLEYLETYYTGKLAEWGYKELSDEYVNKRALVDGYIIGKTEDDKIGVRTMDEKELIGPKYTDIEYVRTTEEFFMTNESEQKGLITKQGQTKIRCEYSDIDVLDTDMGLYLVSKDNKKGVINKDNKKVIYLEYDEIGVDKSVFTGTDIQNSYLFYNNCIPAKKGDKWGLLDKEGKQIIGFDYDEIGCISSTNSSDRNVLLIPEYEAIVVKKGDYYGIYNSLGKELVPCALQDVSQTLEAGKIVYEMIYKDQKLNVEAYFKSHGINKVSTSTSDTSKESGENIDIKEENNQNQDGNQDNSGEGQENGGQENN